MDEKKFCPNCGEQVKSTDAFCPNCGFRFAGGADQSSRRNQHEAVNDQPVDPNDQPATGRPKRHNGALITVSIVAVCLALVIGYIGYRYAFTPGNNRANTASSSSKASQSSSTSSAASSSTASNTTSSATSSASAISTSTVSADDSNNVLSGIFEGAGDDVQSGDASDLSDAFVGGDNNSDYGDLANWVKLQSNNNKVDSVDMSVQDLTTTGNAANFKVKYVFHQTDGRPDHVQIFPWRATLQNSDGNLKISTLKASSTPTSDYNE